MSRAGVLRVVLLAAVLACAISVVLAAVTLTEERTARRAQPSGASPTPAPAAVVERATVLTVADAVTLDVRLPGGREVVRVRALGVETPGACYDGEATAFARRVLAGRAVDLVTLAPPGPAAPTASPSAPAPAVDRFDRRLEQVTLDGGDYAVLAAEAGIARSYSVGADPTTMPPVRDAEARARAAGRGVWGPPCSGRSE